MSHIGLVSVMVFKSQLLRLVKKTKHVQSVFKRMCHKMFAIL